MSEAREAARRAFLQAHGWTGCSLQALPADASARRYFRVRGGGRPALLMDAPPGTLDLAPFVVLADHLRGLGLSTPLVLAAALPEGLVLVEDFGDATFTRMLQMGASAVPLYRMATDVLIHLHRSLQAAAVTVPEYDREFLLFEASLLIDWFWPARHGALPSPEVRAGYMAAWEQTLDRLPPPSVSLVLRDFHVDNLMLLHDRPEIRACGLLDFQDARRGPAAYDLVSLLEDARRDVPEHLAIAMRQRYADALHPDPSFDDWYAVLGAQRHAKVLGIFVRLAVRDGKPGYLEHLPRVTGLLQRQLAQPALAPVAGWFQALFPGWSETFEINPALLVPVLVPDRTPA